MSIVAKLTVNVNTVCDVCKSYPVSTGEIIDGKYEHKCPKCGSICFREKKFPFDHEVDNTTYL